MEAKNNIIEITVSVLPVLRGIGSPGGPVKFSMYLDFLVIKIKFF